MPPPEKWLVASVVEGWDVELELGGVGQWSYAVSRIDIVEAGMRVVVRERFTGTVEEYADLDDKRFEVLEFNDRTSPPDELWRFGVEYADGLRISTVDELWLRRNGFSAKAAVVVSQLWSNSHISDRSIPFWFSPAPPLGPLTFAVEWPLVGLPFLSATTDIRGLTQRARTPVIWPRHGIHFLRE
jgi:hypothetical protein